MLDLTDINAFTFGFTSADPIADINSDGVFDLTDLNMSISGFIAGCP